MVHSLFDAIRLRLRRLPAAQEGVTGLETAIILIAFVVVASVFGYVVLTTGVFATEKSRDATTSGLNQIRTTLMQRGGVTAVKSASTDTVDKLTLRVSTIASGEPIAFSDLTVLYQDANQSESPGFTVVELNGDGDTVIETGELFNVEVAVSNLSVPLGPSVDFMIIIQPTNGSPLYVKRTTPDGLQPFSYLD